MKTLQVGLCTLCRTIDASRWHAFPRVFGQRPKGPMTYSFTHVEIPPSAIAPSPGLKTQILLNSTKFCQILPKYARFCQELPNSAKFCQNLPTDGQRRNFLMWKHRSLAPLGPLPCSLPQLTTTKLGRARVPLTIWRFCDYFKSFFFEMPTPQISIVIY